MITSLTQEQQDKFPDYRDKWLQIGLDCSTIDPFAARDAAIECYKLAEQKAPDQFILFDSPYQACIYVDMLTKDFTELTKPDKQRFVKCTTKYEDLTDEQKASVDEGHKEHVSHNIYGFHDAGWLCFYDFFLNECNVDSCAKLKGLMNLAKNCGWWMPYNELCVLQHKPIFIKRDEQGRLDNIDGPAVTYRDGWSVYAVKGVRVPGWIIDTPDKIKVSDIDDEENAEVRRVMIEQYDRDNPGRYLMDSGAEMIHQDDWGKLYRKELSGDPEPMVMVKVINSTAEPDGTFKEYFLRVPPSMSTAREAVAWTFNVDEDTYSPLQET